MSTPDSVKKQLRKYLNDAIRGPRTDALLSSVAVSLSTLENNTESVNDMIYLVTAEDQYLDLLLAARGLRRPENVGLSDEIFRAIGIEVGNRKQVRSLINSLLRIIFGDEFVSATIDATFSEPYALEDGDTLQIVFDDGEAVDIVFTAAQFQNINAATAQEVSDAITKEIRRLGKTGASTIVDDGINQYVRLISQTVGPSSTVKVTGGKAQNSLRFEYVVPTSGLALTQWTVERQANGNIRMIWSGGPNPTIGVVNEGDYMNMYATSFDPANRGTFTIISKKSGLVGDAYIEFANPIAVDEIVLQGTTNGVLFFRPVRKTLNNKVAFAAAYQTESRLLEVFLPATTKVIRRENKGASHLHDGTAFSPLDQLGPYIWDLSRGFLISEEECLTTQVIDSSTELIINVDNSADFPDDVGHLVLDFGGLLEEGPVPYIGRPSSNSLIVNPAYNFKNNHPSGTNISLVSQNFSYIPDADGSDYPFYITDVVSGRIYAEELINFAKATGIRLEITILYPYDEGLSKWGTENSEISKVFGPDEE